MKKLFLSVLINFIFLTAAYSQTFVEIKIEIGAKRKVIKVDVAAVYPDGDTTWKERIAKRLNTSTFIKKGAKKGKYTVRVAYVICKDGSISDLRCENDPGYGMCQESVRAIRLSTKLVPAPVRPMRSTYIVDSLKVPR